MAVPMLKENELIGTINMYRRQARPFTSKQIEMVQSFASQAVIAIENARLLNQLRESLQQQTATADVLKVISRSAFALQTVLDALVESSSRLCEAYDSIIFLQRGDKLSVTAHHGPIPVDFLDWPITRDWVSGRAFIDRAPVQVEDAQNASEFPVANEMARRLGFHTTLSVPLLRQDDRIGVITIRRSEVKPFTENQIALVRTFADQAVIAIENVRLFEEVQKRTNDLAESLAQQTATADVLKVISRSTFDLQIVLDTLTSSAARLCEAETAGITRQKDGGAYHYVATYGYPAEMDQYLRSARHESNRGSTVGRTLLAGNIVHIHDVLADPEYTMGDLARKVGVRTTLGVPLLREGTPIGVIILARRDVRPFTDAQIALASTFADQAVIAIENVRLFDEVQAQKREVTEALEHQTATSAVLNAISRSPTNAQPVFDVIVESATRLCEGVFGVVWRYDGTLLHYVASYNFTAEVIDRILNSFPAPPDRSLASGRAILENKIAHIPDMLADPCYAHELALAGNWRASIAVPILRDGKAIGAISVGKSEIGPFSEQQIQLLTTFADQAVIAIENVRLFDEVQRRTEDLTESLRQQTATADVLKIISRSAFDLKTVLETLLRSAARLCEADQGTITQRIGDKFYRSVAFGYPQEFMDFIKDFPVEMNRDTGTGRALLESKLVHISDVKADPDYKWADAQRLGGYRAMLGVPMLRESEPIGVLTLTRKDPRPFTEKQIELVTTFADQAAIAIENVRLFESAEARTRELAQSLEELRTAQDRLVQTQKLASLGQLTAGIAHEIKNPLNFVNNFSSLSIELLGELQEMLQALQSDEKVSTEIVELIQTLRANLGKIEQHGMRADSIVKNMLLHSREGSGEHRPMNINAVVEESLNLAYHGARAEKEGFNITLERSFDPAAGEIDLFPQEITRVLLNLISNGFYAATKRSAHRGDGDYEPILKATTKSLGDRVEIRIRDNGIGIPPSVKEKMFNPFFTTKPPGEGTGLGLSLSYDIIVKQHAGLIDVDTKPGEFTEFRIILPRTAASIAKTRAQA